MRKLNNLSILAVITTSIFISSTSMATTARTHNITIDDFFDISGMSHVQLSPNGKQAIWLESRWDKELDKSQRDIWLLDTKTHQSKRMTFTNESESSPQWSPDGEYIYYLGKIKQDQEKAPYNGKAQVFRLSVNTGASQPMTKEVEGIEHFQLSHDGNSL